MADNKKVSLSMLSRFLSKLEAKFAAKTHTHNYAGSSSAGGSATSAVKLDTATAGSATNPVYFTGGKPVKTTYTLGKSVPSDAVFTDTTYSEATTSADGLMTSEDKTKVNYTNIAYGTCATEAATAAKVITVSGNTKWALTAGSRITVKFSYTNTASNPTFNVNNTGAKPIWYNTAAITTSSLSYAGYGNRPMDFVYNGSQFVFIGWSIDNNTTYTNASLGQGYGACTTAEATTEKAVTLSSYALTVGGVIAVKFTYAVPASATLNVNSKGAKAIYYRGAAITANKIKAGDIATFIYNGSQYHLLTVDRDDNTTYTLSSFGVTATAAELNKLDGVTATAAELNYVDGVTSNIQTQLNAKQATVTGGATTITSSNLTVSRALVSDSNGKVAVSAVTSTELGYLDGVTSAVQTQLNAKQATITGGATTIASSNLTASRALVSDSNGKVAVSAVTSTELGYLDGVTSNIQTQLNGSIKGLSVSGQTITYTKNNSTTGTITTQDKYVAQGVSTSAGWRSVLLGSAVLTEASADIATATNQSYQAKGVAVNPSEGIVRSNAYNVEDAVRMQYDSTNKCLNFVFL